MQKPDIKITQITFAEEQKGYPSSYTNIVTTIHYEMAVDDKIYADLRVTGEATNYPDSLRDAINNLDWDVYLDANFTEDEVAILKVARQIFNDEQQDGWDQDNILAYRAKIQMIHGVENNIVRELARQRLLDRQDGAYATTFRISQIGLFIMEAHRQFRSEEDE